MDLELATEPTISLVVPITSWILTGDSLKLNFSTLTKVPFLIFWSDKPPRRTSFAQQNYSAKLRRQGLDSTLNILLHILQEKGSNTCIFLLGLMRSRAEYWCSFWLTPFEWVFAENFYHFWHHDFTSLLLHLLYTLLTWVTHFIFHNKIPVESSHELLRSPTLQATLPHTNATYNIIQGV